MKLGKGKGPKSPIIPVGDFEKVQAADEEESFYTNPLIPWWTKAARWLRPDVERKQTRTATWCKRCGRKHSKREACEHLYLHEDLTVPPIRDDDGDIVRTHTRVGHYSTIPEETTT
jgi:hypothetical protein